MPPGSSCNADLTIEFNAPDCELDLGALFLCTGDEQVSLNVADGYSGNIMLKSVEGAAKLMSGELKKMLTKSAKTKLAYLLLKDGLADFKKMLDPNEVGGTALLGISRPVTRRTYLEA